MPSLDKGSLLLDVLDQVVEVKGAVLGHESSAGHYGLGKVKGEVRIMLNDKVPNRLRLKSTVDLTVAKNHNRCRGTGIVGYRTMENPEAKGQMIKVPIVCQCVVRRGGVKQDAFDKIIDKVSQELSDGSFAQNLAQDVRALEPEDMIRKISELRSRASDPGTAPAVSEAINQALKLIEEEA